MSTSTILTTKYLEELKTIVGEHKPEFCYQCAKCTSGCTAAKVIPEYRPHEIVALTKLGDVIPLFESRIIWACTECLKCSTYCPQDVAPVEVVIALKNVAIKMGYKPPEMLTEMVKNVVDIGFIQGVMEIMTKDFELVERSALNLPELREPPKMSEHRALLSKFFGVVMK